MRRPQRTEDRLRAGGEDGAYLCGALEGWGELNQWPRAQPSGSRLRLKREHGAYRCRCLRSRRTARELAAARGVRAQPRPQSSSGKLWHSAGEQRLLLCLAASAGLSLWQRLISHCIGRRCSPALCQGMQRLSCGIGGARTLRAAANSLAVLRLRRQRQRYAPRSRCSRRRLPFGCARGNCFSSHQPSREPERYAPSSPPARKRSSVRCGRRTICCPLLHLPTGGTLQGTLSAQQSADRSTRPGGRVAPASCWAASGFNSPVGRRNEPSLRFGLLALAPSALYR